MHAQTDNSKRTTGFKRGTPQAQIAHEIAQLLQGRDNGLTMSEIQLGIRRRRILIVDAVKQLVANGTLTTTSTRTGRRDTTHYHLATSGITRRTASAARPKHCDLILERLRKGPATHLELYQLGCIAHSRIATLRSRGHSIDCDRTTSPDGQALYVYTLNTGISQEAAA